MKCKFCDGEIPEHVVKCQHCGEWLDPNHFISLLNTTAGFKSIQKVLTADISESIHAKLVTILTITVPIILFLLGGSGILLIKAAVSDSIITMKKAEYVVDNAEGAIKKALNVEKTLDHLETSKIQFKVELTTLQGNVKKFREQTATIAAGNLQTSELIETQMATLQAHFIELNTRLVQIEKTLGKTPSPVVSMPRISVSQQQQFDHSKESLKRKVEYVKYLIQIGKYSNFSPSSTHEIVAALSSVDFTTIIHDEKIMPKKGVNYSTIIIGQKIPNHILTNFFAVLSQFKTEFSYIRLNEDKTQNNEIFIAASSTLSQQRGDTRLNNKIWTALKSPNSDVLGLIKRLEGNNKNGGL